MFSAAITTLFLRGASYSASRVRIDTFGLGRYCLPRLTSRLPRSFQAGRCGPVSDVSASRFGRPGSPPSPACPTQPVVYFDVLACGLVPGMVLSHSGYLESPPNLRLSIQLDGPPKRLHQRFGRVVAEHDAVCRPAARRIVNYGVGQAPCRPDDGHGAVSKAVHLVQPARLISRRHEKRVGSPFDEMRETL